MDISLSGKTAVVGGSSQGIGLAIARELALCGANCILLSRNAASLQQAVAQLPSKDGQRHQYQLADFAAPDQVQQAIAAIVAVQPVHVLINNTGGPPAGPIAEAETAAFVGAFQQHLVCNHLLAQAVVPGMKEAGYGRIINVISTSVKIPLPNLGVSNTVRGAVASWAKTLSNELAPFGITVNNILPGTIITQRLLAVVANTARQKGISEEQAAAEMMAGIPMGRFADVSELAPLAAFLASPAAAYITGVSIAVDGGRTGSL
jgi:3-oxoacyl-[acyl-carrier protein] reductase